MDDETAPELGIPQHPIKVNSPEFEYVYVANQRCPCGGDYTVVRQELMHTTPPTDYLECRCQKCDQERTFAFDISSFFGHFEKYGRFVETDRQFHEALLQLKMGQLAQAEEAFLRVIDPDEGEPNFAWGLFYLGSLYLALERPAEAYEYLSRAVAIQSLDAPLHQMLAFACRFLGREEESRQQLAMMLDLERRFSASGDESDV
jgi:tetratricopeptide (TPR) repeat protein